MALTQRAQRKARARRNPATTEVQNEGEPNFLVRSGLRIMGIGRRKLNMLKDARMENFIVGNLLIEP
jgi:hypothetical protein